MHHADPLINGIPGRKKFYLLSLIIDLPPVRLIDSEQNIHQCRLPGTIFPQKGVDFPGFHRQIHILIGIYTGKCLRDLFHFQ